MSRELPLRLLPSLARGAATRFTRLPSRLPLCRPWRRSYCQHSDAFLFFRKVAFLVPGVTQCGFLGAQSGSALLLGFVACGKRISRLPAFDVRESSSTEYCLHTTDVAATWDSTITQLLTTACPAFRTGTATTTGGCRDCHGCKRDDDRRSCAWPRPPTSVATATFKKRPVNIATLTASKTAPHEAGNTNVTMATQHPTTIKNHACVPVVQWLLLQARLMVLFLLAVPAVPAAAFAVTLSNVAVINAAPLRAPGPSHVVAGSLCLLLFWTMVHA